MKAFYMLLVLAVHLPLLANVLFVVTYETKGDFRWSQVERRLSAACEFYAELAPVLLLVIGAYLQSRYAMLFATVACASVYAIVRRRTGSSVKLFTEAGDKRVLALTGARLLCTHLAMVAAILALRLHGMIVA